jgi:hypothetical protein
MSRRARSASGVNFPAGPDSAGASNSPTCGAMVSSRHHEGGAAEANSELVVLCYVVSSTGALYEGITCGHCEGLDTFRVVRLKRCAEETGDPK